MTSNRAEMSFFEHLAELRKRILISGCFIVLGFLLSWSFIGKIYYWLTIPVNEVLKKYFPQQTKLAFTALSEPFMLYIKMAFISGLFISSPFIFHQLWLFISPALHKKEKKMVFPFVLMSTLFFIAGGAFGYFVIFPLTCDFLLKIARDFQPVITIDNYFSLAIKMILGIALIFETPTLIFFLAKLKIVSAKFLWKYFRYAIVLIFILAAVLTPTPDIVTQTLFALPMILLYLFSILIARLVNPPEKEIS